MRLLPRLQAPGPPEEDTSPISVQPTRHQLLQAFRNELNNCMVRRGAKLRGGQPTVRNKRNWELRVHDVSDLRTLAVQSHAGTGRMPEVQV
jgi:hypothetical protein